AQFLKALGPVLPLPPKIHTQSSADPRFQIGEHPRGLTKAEVAAPPDEVWFQLFDDLWQGSTPCPAGHLPDPRFKFGESLRCNAPLAPGIRDTKPQELPLLWPCHRAFRLVDLQLEPVGQEPTYRGDDPLAAHDRAGRRPLAGRIEEDCLPAQILPAGGGSLRVV